MQLVAHRLLGSYLNDARVRGRAITAAEKEPAGIYYDAIHYTDVPPQPLALRLKFGPERGGHHTYHQPPPSEGKG